MFDKYILDFETNIFERLQDSCQFEDITVGRKGANLVDDNDGLIPLVRTTTSYDKPVQAFTAIHHYIIEKIKTIVNASFNNALIEIYDDKYRSMGYHSDQALDLADDSYICIYSCYDDPTDINSVRKLKIKNKISNEHYDLSLDHNSIILFSVSTNRNHLHKIVLDSTSNGKTRWLGITFRLSKTFIKFINEIPYFYPQLTTILRMANNEEKKEFYKMRGKENSTIDFTYQRIDYTLSVSDTLNILSIPL